MAEVDVKRQTSEQQRNQSLERSRQSGRLERHGGYPSLFSGPADFFSTSPFALMRRFTDEMDRLFEGHGWRGSRSESGAVGRLPLKSRNRTESWKCWRSCPESKKTTSKWK